MVPGFGHAESGASNSLVDRIGGWVQQAVLPGSNGRAGPAAGAVSGAAG